jgi:hypothetical protein
MVLGVGAAATSAQVREEAPPPEPAWEWDASDPRIGLEAGHLDAEEAISNLEMLATLFKPEAFVGDEAAGRGFTNTDIAFQGDNVFLGNYYGLSLDCASRSSARVARATSRSIGICCSCPWSRRAVVSTAAPRACRTV